MKKLIQTSALILTFAIVCLAQGPGWPRQKSSPAGKLVYYQPQVDDWKNHTDLDFSMAFSLTPAGGKQTVGVANLRAKTDVSVDDRTVLLHDFVTTDNHFPSLDSGAAAQMDQLVKTFWPTNFSTVISLDRLIASINKVQSAPTVELRNDPPVISSAADASAAVAVVVLVEAGAVSSLRRIIFPRREYVSATGSNSRQFYLKRGGMGHETQ